MAPLKPSRPRRLRRDEQRQRTRARLLDAAERVFAREGLRGASIAAIATEAGYSHGAIYSNFDSKEDLFLVLVEERIDARLARVYQAADTALSQRAEPLEAARRFVVMLQQERDAMLLLVDFWNQAVRDHVAAAKFAERHARLRALIGRIVDGIARDLGAALTRPRDQVATALITLANGFAIERLADPEAAPDELFAHAIAALLRGFSEQPGASVRKPTPTPNPA
jgi:AcrR family transcriptional regulator